MKISHTLTFLDLVDVMMAKLYLLRRLKFLDFRCSGLGGKDIELLHESEEHVVV